MKRPLCILAAFLCVLTVSGKHIKGGWIQYQYQGPATTAGYSVYTITVNLFRSCTEAGPMPASLGIFDAYTDASVQTITGTADAYHVIATPTKTDYNPCLSDPPLICYKIFSYTTNVTLADNPNGYIIAASDAYRISDIVNITNSSATGISFTATIPGRINGIDYHVNSNPIFEFRDTAIVCYRAPFLYQFAAKDADNDSLSYDFGPGINGTATLSSPPYSSLTYAAGYSGFRPLGLNVKIDARTGMISGTAPATIGEYVIAVYVTEWRSGVPINTTKKELQIQVADCSLSAASLKPVYTNCRDYSFTFENESSASSITQYAWDFGVTTSLTDTSGNPTPTYTYADTGSFTIKLKVSNTAGCVDSATAIAKVYPGFHVAFTASGNCYVNPYLFRDMSSAKYGSVNSRSWSFGEGTGRDTSTLRDPAWLYAAPGPRTVILTAGSTKGCLDTASLSVNIRANPSLVLPFHDTLICSIDTLQLKVIPDSGALSWTPVSNIINNTTATPSVYPKDTTVYRVTVSNNGCTSTDSIRVNVLRYISVKAGRDTVICRTDTIHLTPVSYALSWVWTASTGETVDSVKYPRVKPLSTTEYYVVANLGKCQARDSVRVRVSPYPVAQAGPDTAICYGSTVKLRSTIVGTAYTWNAVSTLANPQSQTPLAHPSQTTAYILTVSDTLGCGKPVSDTASITVVPLPTVIAGHDTIAVIGQPVQLQAISNTPSANYAWTPPTGLNASTISNPVATLGGNTDSIRYFVSVTDPNGCSAKDSVRIKIFRTGAGIFVAGAFTPNGDGQNDVLHAIPAGIATFEYFRIYSRWGQLLFQTSDPGKGWDGTIDGQKQLSGTYIFTAQGTDYAGRLIFRKGTVVLIR